MSDDRRLTIVQSAGDYRDAALRLAGGGAETYRAQRYTVDFVGALAQRLAAVTTIVGWTDERHDEMLPNGVRAIGAGFSSGANGRELVKLVAETDPDLLILRSPVRELMWWAIRKRRRTLLLLADSFNGRSLKNRAAGLILAMLCRSRYIEVVANHGNRAARQLVALGVPAAKVMAWDYPAQDTPHDRTPKDKAGPERRLFYAGALNAAKGVDDLIDAVALLRDRGMPVVLDLIGGGETDRLAALIEAKGLTGSVKLVGLVANTDIIPRMVAADAVVVPSRHEYPEGMPLTIYEACCSRTPLILSDHPMFVGNVVDGEEGLMFPGGDSAALADRIAALFEDDALYARLSKNCGHAWERLQIPTKWHEIIDKWIGAVSEARLGCLLIR